MHNSASWNLLGSLFKVNGDYNRFTYNLLFVFLLFESTNKSKKSFYSVVTEPHINYITITMQLVPHREQSLSPI